MATQVGSSDLVPASAIDIHEELWSVSDRIHGVLFYAAATATWLIALGFLYFIGEYLVSWVYPLATVVLYAGVLLFAIFSPFVWLDARKARRALLDWEDNFMPFRYSVKFELLPPTGTDRERDIFERYAALYPKLRRAEKPVKVSIPPRVSRTPTLVFRGNVKGKKGEHHFDVFARDPERSFRAADDFFDLFVRRFTSGQPVTRADLQALKSDVEDVVRKRGPEDFLVGAFSTSGFTDDAVQFAQSEEGVVKGDVAIDLIQEGANGYSIVFV